jgi:hypothetical protein
MRQPLRDLLQALLVIIGFRTKPDQDSISSTVYVHHNLHLLILFPQHALDQYKVRRSTESSLDRYSELQKC